VRIGETRYVICAVSRDLVCLCAPLACHGDLLHRLANASRNERITWWHVVNVAVEREGFAGARLSQCG